MRSNKVRAKVDFQKEIVIEKHKFCVSKLKGKIQRCHGYENFRKFLAKKNNNKKKKKQTKNPQN